MEDKVLQHLGKMSDKEKKLNIGVTKLESGLSSRKGGNTLNDKNKEINENCLNSKYGAIKIYFRLKNTMLKLDLESIISLLENFTLKIY